MGEIDREKPDAAEAPTEEFDAISDRVEGIDTGRYRLVDMRKIYAFIVAWVIVFVVFASGSAFLSDVFAWIFATIICVVLFSAFFIWLANTIIKDAAPRRWTR